MNIVTVTCDRDFSGSGDGYLRTFRAICIDRAVANKALAEHFRSEWEKEKSQGGLVVPADPLPEDDEAAIEAYKQVRNVIIQFEYTYVRDR